MKDVKSFKTSGLLAMVFGICAMFIFFTSTTTVKKSEMDSISKLSADLEKVTAELNALKTERNEESAAIEPLLGEIMMFSGNFAPRGWALCDGQLLPIASYSALFSIIGTTYGGDGKTTFALPDLRGRVPMHAGAGSGLSSRRLGEKSGMENNSLRTTQVGVTPSPTKEDAVVAISGIADGFNVMQPYNTVNFCIALEGVFPSRN